jgi:hypothetical protein
MSIYATNSSTINQSTGLPVNTGVIYVTMTGQYYSTNPIGESPYGVNSTPGTSSSVPGNGVPYNFTPPVNIGPTG